MITQIMQDFGVFDGDISSMPIAMQRTPTLIEQQGYNPFRNPYEAFAAWVYDEIQGSRKVRGDEPLPPFTQWLKEF